MLLVVWCPFACGWVLLGLISSGGETRRGQCTLSVAGSVTVRGGLGLFGPGRLTISLRVLPRVLCEYTTGLVSCTTIRYAISRSGRVFTYLGLQSRRLLCGLTYSIV